MAMECDDSYLQPTDRKYIVDSPNQPLMTFNAIGEIIGVGADQVTKIYNNAIVKIRHPSNVQSLEGLVSEDATPDWMYASACLGQTALLFTSTKAMSTKERQALTDICNHCPVIEPCRALANILKPKCGVWAGEIKTTRSKYR